MVVDALSSDEDFVDIMADDVPLYVNGKLVLRSGNSKLHPFVC